jgi:hypothetical protein
MRAVIWLCLTFVFLGACTELEHAKPDAGDVGDGGGPREDAGRDASDRDVEEHEMPDATTDERDGGALEDGSSPDADRPTHDAGMDGETPDDPYTLEDFCDEIITASCEWRVADYPDGGTAQCENVNQVYGAICDGPFQNAIENDRVVFDPEMAQQCVAAHAVVDGEPLSEDDPFSDLEGPCFHVVQGQVENGEDCYVAAVFGGFECAEGYCAWAGTCPSQCHAFSQVGDSCDGELEYCEASLYCRDDTGECAAYGELGDDCGPSQYCDWEAGFYCKDQKCALREPDGTACTAHDQCESLVCAWLTDEQTQGVCATRQEEGGDCQVDDGCVYPLMCVVGECALLSDDGLCFTDDNCPAEERCMYLDGAMRCEVPLPADSVCSWDGPDCADGLECLTLDGMSSCLRYGIEGDRCESGRQCDYDAFWCQFNEAMPTCTARGGQGAGCDPLVWNSCQDDLQCVWAGTCEAYGRALGESCHPEREGACASGAFCDRDTHTCVANRGADGVCNNITHEGCNEAHFCECTTNPCGWDPAVSDPNARCVAKLPDNAVCEDDRECASANCNGTCQEEQSLPDALACNGLE